MSPEGYSGEEIPEFREVKEIIRMLSLVDFEEYKEYENGQYDDEWTEENIKILTIINTGKFLTRSDAAVKRKSLFNKWKDKNEELCHDFERQLLKLHLDFSDLWYASCYLADFIDCMEYHESDYNNDYRINALIFGKKLTDATSEARGTNKNKEENYELIVKEYDEENVNGKTLYRTTDTQWIRLIGNCVTMAIFDDSFDWKQIKDEYWSLSATHKRYYFHEVMTYYLKSKVDALRWEKNLETAESVTTFMMFAMGLIKDKQGNLNDKYMKTLDDRKKAYSKMKCDPPKEQYRGNFYDNIWSFEPDDTTETTVE